jgi:hypothetical protein
MKHPTSRRKQSKDMRFQQWLTLLGITFACLMVIIWIEWAL